MPEGETHAPDKLRRYPLMPERGEGALLRVTRQTNEKLRSLFTDGHEDWRLCDHFAGVRWSLLHEIAIEYARNTGLGKATVHDLERPDRDGHPEHETVVRVLDYWRTAGPTLDPAPAALLKETEQMILRLIIGEKDWNTVYGLYERWSFQVSHFHERAGITYGALWQIRRQQSKTHAVIPFHEVVRVAGNCGRNIMDPKDASYDATWAEDAVATWKVEALENMHRRDVPEPVALLHVLGQLAGLRMTAQELARVLGSSKTADTLAAFELTAPDAVEPLLRRLQNIMGDKECRSLRRAWQQAYQQMLDDVQTGRRKTFATEIERLQRERGLPNEQLARLFRLHQQSIVRPSHVIRAVRSGVVSAILSAGGLAWAVTRNVEETERLLTLYRDEKRACTRRKASATQFSPLSFARESWGITPDALVETCNRMRSGEDPLWTRGEVMRLEQSDPAVHGNSHRLAHALAAVEDLGRAVIAAYEERLRPVEPATIEEALAAAMDRAGSLAHLERAVAARSPSIPYTAIAPAARGRRAPECLPHLLGMLDAAGDRAVLCTEELVEDWQLMKARELSRTHPPLARVLRTIVARVSTSLREFWGLTSIVSYNVLARIFRNLNHGTAPAWEHVEAILRGAGYNPAMPQWHWVQCVWEKGSNMQNALALWRERMQGFVDESPRNLPGILASELSGNNRVATKRVRART